MPTERYLPIPMSCDFSLINGTGAGPVTLVTASTGLIPVIWGIEGVLSGTTTQTVKSGTTEIDLRRTSTVRTALMPVGHMLDEVAMPAFQGVAAGDAITIEFAGSVTYSFKVRYAYVAP